MTRIVFLSAMTLGFTLIATSSLAYFDVDELPPFVIEKLPVRFESLWLASLRVHVAAAVLSFPLCILLMTRALQRRAVMHRWIGRAAGVLVLFALVPSGAVLAFDAKGGASVTAGFLLSGALVAWFMVSGVRAARARDLVAHRRAMLHVFAQMSVAVTSRALLFGLDAAGVAPETAYVVALWGPVLWSTAVAEVSSKSSGSLGRIVHVFSKMAMGAAPSRRNDLAEKTGWCESDAIHSGRSRVGRRHGSCRASSRSRCIRGRARASCGDGEAPVVAGEDERHARGAGEVRRRARA